MSLAIISGALANKPFNGGNAWSRLSWVLGFQKLGWDVIFVEQIDSRNCLGAEGAAAAFENSINLTYFKSTMEQFGLEQACSLICDRGDAVFGLPLQELLRQSARANFIFNISGHLTLPELMGAARCKIYYDDDPGFTQFWHAANNPGSRLSGHDFYFTIGGNIGSPECPIPTNGLTWHHVRPPVVLEHWQRAAEPTFTRFTTVASWRGAYGPVQHDGKTYGIKAHEFRKFFLMPRRNGAKFEIALQIDPADHKDANALAAYGWHLIDPRTRCATPAAFRDYITGSGAEFSAAQGVYVETNSGWFSDRTVRYLAAGRPALIQDTGFSRHYPVGRGLVPFSNLEEAIAGAEAIERDYPAHCQAARQIAEEYFDSDRVIRQMAAQIGLGLPGRK